jgi:orotidine-5'-phosphate decarboxylase
MDHRDRLIVALDLGSVGAADTLVSTLGDTVTFYKIGYQLAFSGGLDFGRELVEAGKKVFIDLKLHDIPNTVSRGVEAIARTGATFLTVHAYPQTMAAAMAGARGSPLRILGVSVLTSYDDDDLRAAGYGSSVATLVARRAEQALEASLDGLVLSPGEAAAVRARAGTRLTLVTPGVRPTGSPAGDQKRVMTPREAVAAGADHLVIGRPITASADPAASARAILAELAEAS